MQEVFFVPVKEGADQKLLEKLGAEIWLEYWPNLIGEEQTNYMVDNFCSLDAIQAQMAAEGYEYWFACVPRAASTSPYETSDGLAIVGYTGGYQEHEPKAWFISKVYLLAAERGKHYASRILDFHESLCKDRGLPKMHLHVKRTNQLGVRAYKGRGMHVAEEITADIGGGFILYDYDMEKEIR